MNKTLSLYQSCAKFPLGKITFSKGLTFRVPFFASIRPKITDLHPGHCRVKIKDRRSIRNHIGSINAGALCTLSELAGGLAVEASIPPNLRWIPKEMSVEYVKKAKGTITGICEFDPKILAPGDVRLPIKIQDKSGDVVLRASILFYLSERPAG
jgi:acyl-coenzyme A thioesterase PaaI-like protein